MVRKTKTHYELLGVASDATRTEIDDAYYKLEAKYFPEEQDDDFDYDAPRSMAVHLFRLVRENRFGAISHSHDVLMDFEKRLEYDKGLAIYTQPKYIFDSKVMRVTVRTLIAFNALALVIVVWNAVVHREASVYLANQYAKLYNSWILVVISLIGAVALAAILIYVRKTIMRKRWSEWKGTVAYDDLKSQLDRIVASWLPWTLASGSVVVAQADYVTLF